MVNIRQAWLGRIRGLLLVPVRWPTVTRRIHHLRRPKRTRERLLAGSWRAVVSKAKKILNGMTIPNPQQNNRFFLRSLYDVIHTKSGYSHNLTTFAADINKRRKPMWTKPEYAEMRFGFEVTMYVASRE